MWKRNEYGVKLLSIPNGKRTFIPSSYSLLPPFSNLPQIPTHKLMMFLFRKSILDTLVGFCYLCLLSLTLK